MRGGDRAVCFLSWTPISGKLNTTHPAACASFVRSSDHVIRLLVSKRSESGARPAVSHFPRQSQPVADPEADRGSDGPAALARASRMVTIGGASRGSGNTPTERIEARRYEVECRLDLMRARGLEDRLWRAGIMFRRYWRTMHGSSLRISTYDERQSRGKVSLLDIEQRTEAEAQILLAYTVLSVAQRMAVVAVAGEDEAVGTRSETLHRGLGALADLWLRPLRELMR